MPHVSRVFAAAAPRIPTIRPTNFAATTPHLRATFAAELPQRSTIFQRRANDESGAANAVMGAGTACLRVSASIVRLRCACQGRALSSRRLHLDNARSAGKLRLLGNTKRIFKAWRLWGFESVCQDECGHAHSNCRGHREVIYLDFKLPVGCSGLFDASGRFAVEEKSVASGGAGPTLAGHFRG